MIILIIAAVASGFMGDIESAAVILIVITMNAILGTVQTDQGRAVTGKSEEIIRAGSKGS